MSLSSIVSRIVPAAIGFATGGPVGAFTATVATEQAKSQEKRIRSQQAAIAQERENIMAQYPPGFDPVTGQYTSTMPTTQQAGMGGFFGGVSDFFRGAGEVVSSAFGSGLPQLFGVGRPRGVGQQPAVTSVTNIGAQESQGSGSIQAGMGTLIPGLVSGARSLIRSPLGQTGIGTAIGTAVALLGPDGKPMRVTRKLKSQLKMLLNQTNNNYALVGDFLGLSMEQMLFILNKRFRNDGPVVTKAALRKTRSTIRKMKNMCDMYDDLRPAARRRSPMKRATRTTTLIKN